MTGTHKEHREGEAHRALYSRAVPRTIKVVQGECLASIAERFGFRDWRTVYADPANAELREKRPDPNHLLPGDEVVIPDKRERLEERATGARHRFVTQRQSTRLRLQIHELEPVRYRVTVGDVVHEGAGSMIDHEISPQDTTALLEVWLDPESETPQLTWRLALGRVDPHDEASGVRTRLDNLGFRAEDLTEAVRSFQRTYGFSVNGQIDAELHRQLRQVHDIEG